MVLFWEELKSLDSYLEILQGPVAAKPRTSHQSVTWRMRFSKNGSRNQWLLCKDGIWPLSIRPTCSYFNGKIGELFTQGMEHMCAYPHTEILDTLKRIALLSSKLPVIVSMKKNFLPNGIVLYTYAQCCIFLWCQNVPNVSIAVLFLMDMDMSWSLGFCVENGLGKDSG